MNQKTSIIGGGIGGLCTALAFEKVGISYQLYEKSPAIEPVGAGIWLAPNALQVLEHLELLDRVREKGNSIDRITVGKADLSPLSDTGQDTIKKHFGYSTIAIHRGELQQILIEALPSEKVHLGKAFKSFQTLPSGQIQCSFQDGTESISDFLIGADGINSGVRNQLFPQSQTRHSGQTCWRGVADFELPAEFQHRGMELWGDRIRFGISGIDQNKVYWFAVASASASASSSEKVQPEQLKEKLSKMYQEFHPLVGQLISNTPKEKILRNDILDLKPMDRWHKGKICLMGDAGHATTPNMGQGGAQAMEDAYFLAHFIQKNSKNPFEAFQNFRQKKVNSIVSQSWTTGQMAHWKYGQGLRNTLLKNMPKKFLEKKMMEMYSLEKIQ